MKQGLGIIAAILLLSGCGAPPLEKQGPAISVPIDPALITVETLSPQSSSGDTVFFVNVIASLQYTGNDTFDSIGAGVTVYKSGDTVAAKNGIAKLILSPLNGTVITHGVTVQFEADSVFTVTNRQLRVYDSLFQSPYLDQFFFIISRFVGYKQ